MGRTDERNHDMQAVVNPTPQEIRLRCREIQRTWTRREEWTRAGRPRRTWTAPTVRTADVLAAAGQIAGDERAASVAAFERAADVS